MVLCLMEQSLITSAQSQKSYLHLLVNQYKAKKHY